MTFPLPTIVKRSGKIRRKAIILREIKPTGMMATDLFRAAYMPILDAWGAVIPQIDAEYARSLSALQTDSAVDIGQIMTQADGLLTRLFLLIRPSLKRIADQIEAAHRGKWRGTILSATSIDIGTFIGPEGARETIATFVERNVGLVRDVSDEIRRRIERAAYQGFVERTPARDVARQISEATGMARRRALNIASDQVGKLSSALDAERREEAGIDVWRWRHSSKLHPREDHLKRNGAFYSDSTGKIGSDITPPGGEKTVIEKAPDRDDWPGMKPFCGCGSVGVLILDGEMM